MKAILKIWTLLLCAGLVLCCDPASSEGTTGANENPTTETQEQPLSDGSIFSHTIGNTNVLIGTGDWNSITSGNGRYVAIGDNTLAAKRYSAYSDNGTDWLYKEQASVFTWSGNVVYGNGKFVTSGTDAASYERGVLTSTDGIDWTFTQLAGNVVLQSIIYTDKFIGIDTKGNVFTSEDGTDWISQATDMAIGNVCENRGFVYGNDIYVVLGENGTMIYSSNLENWTEAEFSQREDNDMPKAVAYGNDKFVAVGTVVFYSSNGSSWTKVDTEYVFSDIVFADNQFIAVGIDPTNNEQTDNEQTDNEQTEECKYKIMTSSDGIAWTVQDIEANATCICIMQ